MNYYQSTEIFALIALSITCVIIAGIFWQFGQQLTTIPRELKVIISILFADLIWSLIQIIQIFCTHEENSVLNIIMGTIQNFALEVSQTFAVLTAFCAYKTLHDHQYLYRKGNQRTIIILGYIFPTFESLLQSFFFVMDYHFFEIDYVFLLNTSLILYPFVCVLSSLIFYIKVYQSFDVLKLNDSEKAQVNTLFLFPLIILIFVLLPQVLQQAKQYSLAVIIYALYGLSNCWVYRRSLIKFTRNVKYPTNLSYDSNLEISLFQSHLSHESNENE